MSEFVIIMRADHDRFKEALTLGHLTNLDGTLYKCSRKYAHDLGLYIVIDYDKNVWEN